MSRFVTVNRDTAYLMPPSVDGWLPEDHLARYVVEVVDALDLSQMIRRYAGRGSDAHHPAVLSALLIYGYATGTYSSRKIEAATYDSLAFRYIAGNTHPDHDTLASFRRRFIGEIKALFVQVLLIARENRLLKLGHIALDGTKVKANASRHSALSYGHIRELEKQLQGEVAALLTRAEAADTQAQAQGLDIPAELARREKRLARITQAKARSKRWPPSGTRSNKPSMKSSARPMSSGANRIRANAVEADARPAHRVRSSKTRRRSISPMKTRASCRWRAQASSNAITRNSEWTPRAA
jgi:transposase